MCMYKHIGVMYVCMYVCVYVCICVCVCVCCVSVNIDAEIYKYNYEQMVLAHKQACVSVYICVCVYVCTSIWTYMYVCA